MAQPPNYFRAPRPGQLDQLGTLLEGLVTRDPKAIATHLGVTVHTLMRWQRDGDAPRMARLALFWETHHGLAVAHCDAINGERVARNLARGLEAANRDLRTRIAYLEEIGDFGAANAPMWAAR